MAHFGDGPRLPWIDAYDSVVTLVKRGDSDILGRTVGEVVDERVRLAFEPLVRAETERLRAALEDFVDGAPCDFVGNYCAEHKYKARPGECPNAVARELLWPGSGDTP